LRCSHRPHILSARPHSQKESFDINIDIGIEAPMEDIPEKPNEVDGKGEDDFFTHFLSSSDSQPPPSCIRPDYKHRLQAEQAEWAVQHDEHMAVYIEWKVHGPQLELEGDSFICRVI